VILPEEILLPLPWDSKHFGFQVGRITIPHIDDALLAVALQQAQEARIRLVYWPTHANRYVSEGLLGRFGGVLADRKTIFEIDLTKMQEAGLPKGGEGAVITEYPRASASVRLLDLAVSAGAHSRFSTDRRVPRDKFEALYRTWINRSTFREIADVVLIASVPDARSDPVGMVTVSVQDSVGQIGLIAVHESIRGRGLGQELIRAAHKGMSARGAHRSIVVTQLENRAACRLYEKSGYSVAEVVPYYHFWPLEGSKS